MTDKNIDITTNVKKINMATLVAGGFLKDKKTVLTAVLSLISCVIAYLVGDIGVVDLMQIVVPLFGVLFLGKNIQSEMGQQLAEINKNLLSKGVSNIAKAKSDVKKDSGDAQK